MKNTCTTAFAFLAGCLYAAALSFLFAHITDAQRVHVVVVSLALGTIPLVAKALGLTISAQASTNAQAQ